MQHPISSTHPGFSENSHNSLISGGNDFHVFLSDLNVFINYIKKKYPHFKIVLLGHSLGGLIATGYIEKYCMADYLILSNPLLDAPSLKRLFNFFPYKLLGKIRIKKRHSESSEMLKYSYNDPLASNYFTLHLLGAIFDQGITFVSKRFNDVNIPVLLLGGDIDPLIKTNRFKCILSKFGSSNKKMIIYKNVKHRLLQSDKKDDVINDIIEWVNSQFD